METKSSGEADGLLSKALKEWKVSDELPPRFADRVWRRIDRSEPAAPSDGWIGLIRGLGQVLDRPSLAASYLGLVLLAGLMAGYWQGRVDTARSTEQLGTRYVQMMDPYQSGRH